MINATQIRKRKRRNIGSILNNLGGRKMPESESIALAPVIEKPATETPVQTINRLAGRGINFDVSENDFTISGAALLTEVEGEFLEANQPAILCTLQQGVLVREVFARDERKLKEFQFDIFERQAIIGESETDEQKIYFNAVRDASKRWFAELLKEV